MQESRGTIVSCSVGLDLIHRFSMCTKVEKLNSTDVRILGSVAGSTKTDVPGGLPFDAFHLDS